MVLCWFNIDLSTGRVQKFLDLGKCSRQKHLFLSDLETNIDTGPKNHEQGQFEVNGDPTVIFFGLTMIFSLLDKQKQKKKKDRQK